MKMFSSIKDKILIGLAVIGLISGMSYYAYTAITGEALMNVQDSTATYLKAVRVKDAGTAGDNVVNGLMSTGLYLYDGSNWDRVVGDSSNGIDVDVTRLDDGGNSITVDDGGGSLTVDGNNTPSDSYSNPTDAVDSFSLLGMFNGTSWDRVRGDITNGIDVDVTRLNDGGNSITVDDGGTTLSVDDGGGSLTVDGTVTVQQTTHDNLNLNANIQVGNTDVSTTNPVPNKHVLGSTMNVGQVSVGTTATQIVAANTSRMEVMIQNLDATNDIYCGSDNTVTTTSGFKIPAGSAFIDDKYNGAYYCIAGATVSVAYREVQ